jgi:hypothetical protein
MIHKMLLLSEVPPGQKTYKEIKWQLATQVAWT